MLGNKKLIVFDFDGTLINSHEDVKVSINKALHDMGYPTLSNDRINQLIGPDLEQALANVIDDTLFDFKQFEILFVHYYDQLMVSSTALYPGVKQTLTWLQDQAKQLAILTNKPANQAIKIAKELQIDSFFCDIVGPDTFNSAKPNPTGLLSLIKKSNMDVSQVLFIGDTEVDIQTGNAANVDVLAVTYGYRTINQLNSEKPIGFLHSITDLITD